MKARFASEVENVQGETSRHVALATVTIDGESVDLMFNVDLTGMWVPHHKHLYDRDQSHYHTNRIANGGSTIDDFSERWDWVTDCIWIYVPKDVGPSLTITRVLVGNKWVTINDTVPAKITPVSEFKPDRLSGDSERLVTVDLARLRAGSLRFGEFPFGASNKGWQGSSYNQG